MQKLSIQKISVLGLVLMAASAVTAAVLPSKKSDKAFEPINGSLTASANDPGLFSCTPTDGNYVTICHNTASDAQASGSTRFAGDGNNTVSDNTTDPALENLGS